MAKGIHRLRRKSHLINKFGLDQRIDIEVVVQRMKQVVVESHPDDRRGIQRAFCRGLESVDASTDSSLKRGGHTHVRDVAPQLIFTGLHRQAPPARRDRGPSPRRRTGSRQRARQRLSPEPPPRGRHPAAPRPTLRHAHHSVDARAIVCAPEIRVKAPLVFRAVGDQRHRRGARNYREEVGQHRLADIVDPVRVLDDIHRRLIASERGGVDQSGQSPPAGIRFDVRH